MLASMRQGLVGGVFGENRHTVAFRIEPFQMGKLCSAQIFRRGDGNGYGFIVG